LIFFLVPINRKIAGKNLSSFLGADLDLDRDNTMVLLI